MFSRLLIANRGEIACRIARTARRLGLESIAVYSDADRNALHVRSADRAIRIGAPPARESYLDVAAVLAAARESGAEAIHPGYGFLSENEEFAEACAAAGLLFVGPPAAAIRAMGSKSEARLLMAAAGVPVLPGYDGSEQDEASLRAAAQRCGFPLLIKPTAGGGGKGMRIVRAPAEFDEALAGARREAAKAFGDDRVLLERFVEQGRHIEIQVFADAHGNVVHLFERDCSLQRRHQKVVEEAPASRLPDSTRRAMGEAAVAGRARGRLSRCGHRRVPLRRQRVLLPGDEHPAAGRASGHRDGHRSRPGRVATARGGRRATAAATGSNCRSTGTRSRRDSMPRTRPADSCHRPAGCAACVGLRRRRACASMRASPRATKFHCTTTRCSPSWSRTDPTARPRSRDCARPSPAFRSTGYARTRASSGSCWAIQRCARVRRARAGSSRPSLPMTKAPSDSSRMRGWSRHCCAAASRSVAPPAPGLPSRRRRGPRLPACD